MITANFSHLQHTLLKRKSKFYIWKNTLRNTSETTWWFSSWVFLSLFKLHPSSVHLGIPLSQQNPPVKKTHKLILPGISMSEIEHGGWDFLVLFFSLDWLTLINSGRWFQMMPRQAGSYSPVVYYFTLPGAQSLTFTTLKGHEVKFYSQI